MRPAALQIKKALADAIRRKMAKEGLNLSSFSRKISTERNALRRILDEKSTSITLNTMVKTAEALDLELTLSVKPMPIAELEKIAEKLAGAKNARQADKLKRQFLAGYYGRPVRLTHAKNPTV